MKNAFIFLVFFSSLYATAQIDTTSVETDSVEVRLIQLPDSSAIGTPYGNKVSKEIGPTGGTVISDDGKVELIFPADALDQTTEISIQPVEGLIPNATKAYQFQPSGIHFKKPVQILFHYSDKEAETCPPELKFMALQDHTGKWEYMNYTEWDSITNSLKGSITHFSIYVDANEVALNNTVITIKVGKTHQFSLDIVYPPLPPDRPGDDELPHLPRRINTNNREVLWKVNGRKGGSAKYGMIVANRGQDIKATYTAPAKLTTDTIAVELQLNDVFVNQIRTSTGRGFMVTSRRRTSNIAKFSCKVNLYDEFKVTVSHDIKVDGGRMTDTSVFNLRIGIEDRASISDIHNQMAKVHIRQSRCRAVYVNAATCVGMINVTGLKTSNIRPASSDGSMWVDVSFSSAPLVFPVINFPPCGGNKASVTTPPAVSNQAFPMFLSFQPKNEKQYVSLGKGYGTTVVSRPDPEDITAAIEPVRDE